MKTFHSFAALIISVVLAALLTTACNKRSSDTKPDNVDYYTCTMHPSVRSQDPRREVPDLLDGLGAGDEKGPLPHRPPAHDRLRSRRDQ